MKLAAPPITYLPFLEFLSVSPLLIPPEFEICSSGLESDIQ